MDYLEAVIEDLSNTGLGTRDLEKDLEDKKQKQGGLQKDITELLTELDEGTQVVNEFQVRTFPSSIYHDCQWSNNLFWRYISTWIFWIYGLPGTF